jgi:cytochrome c oxidase assembly protein subunit 15
VVGRWLATVSASIFAIVVIGGHTPLTKSGLSMVRWEPHRVLPPTNAEEWAIEFEEYKKSPEWLLVNKDKGMDVNGFKSIFFWEWFHRMVGRSIGIIFFVPGVYFAARGYIKNRLRNILLGMFGLGAMQGFIGWWMVKSGLIDKKKTNEVDKTPRVSPYRLTVHAGNAYFLYAGILW